MDYEVEPMETGDVGPQVTIREVSEPAVGISSRPGD